MNLEGSRSLPPPVSVPAVSPPPVSREVARSWDRRAMEEYGIPGIVLMENAAQGSAALLLGLLEREPDRWAPPFQVICGPGQNGGDGFAIARHLHNAGHAVAIHLVLPRSRTDPRSDAGVNLAVAARMGIEVREPPEDLLRGAAAAAARGVIVDAMLGTGLARPLDSPYREWVEAVNRSGQPVAAIDLPTGLDADTGEVLGAAVRADWTFTIAAPKLGFTRGAGPAHTGRVAVVPISIPREVMASRA